jgi:HSP20 family molecular chaperone IbpA
MSFFPRTIYPADTSFTPLFRLLDDFDTYRNEVQGIAQNGSGRKGSRTSLRTFNPKFDVRETENTYELHGELPGIERENINIEFTEPQTIVIHGHVERSYQSGTPPAGLLENGGGAQMSGAITEGGEQHHKGHKVTVEDEADEQANKNKGTVAKQDNKQQGQQQGQQQPKEKFWVSERSIGEFSRTFSFPSRVDQEGVSASLKDGILNITVPKEKKQEGRRRIAVN